MNRINPNKSKFVEVNSMWSDARYLINSIHPTKFRNDVNSYRDWLAILQILVDDNLSYSVKQTFRRIILNNPIQVILVDHTTQIIDAFSLNQIDHESIINLRSVEAELGKVYQDAYRFCRNQFYAEESAVLIETKTPES
jgi:hypothetical protein